MMTATIVHYRLAFSGVAIVSFLGAACSSDGGATGGGARTRLPVDGGIGTGGSSAGGAGLASGGNVVSTGGSVATGGATNPTGGTTSGSGGAPATGGAITAGAPGAGGASTTRCEAPNLVWKTANKTHYTSYPDPGSPECIQYNGCTWAGLFAACNDKKPESWVASHDIVALFPLDPYADHDLCLRSGMNEIVVTAIDTCGDSDCNGCCTRNKGSADALVDIES